MYIVVVNSHKIRRGVCSIVLFLFVCANSFPAFDLFSVFFCAIRIFISVNARCKSCHGSDVRLL